VAIWTGICNRWRKADPVEKLRDRLEKFRDLVQRNNQILELIADAGEKLGGEYIFDIQYLKTLARELGEASRGIVLDLNAITSNRYPELLNLLDRIGAEVQAALESRVFVPETDFVIPMEQIDGELSDVVGEKMARLGEIHKRLGCPVPDGFAVTANACHHFLRKAGVDQGVEEWFDRRGTLEQVPLVQRSSDLRERLYSADLPRDLVQAIRRGFKRLKSNAGCETLAVRSSALGEDGELSFAGQYRTVLGVTPARMPMAYKEVLASLYSTNVMRYRQSTGMHPARGLMAVGFLCMIPARASGVLYTLDPSQPDKDVLVVSATWGLGKTVVEGTGAVDRFEISRQSPHDVLSRSIRRKREMYVAEPGQSIKKVRVSDREQKAPAVTEAQLRELAEIGLMVEKYMKRAQDIEWAVHPDGRVFVLQVRPLRIVSPDAFASPDIIEIADEYLLLLKNRGEVACRGIGSGHVHIVSADDPLDNLPEDVVLVARSSTPRLAAAMAKASAVLTDVGTSTGHLAALAREFRIPTIVDTRVATHLLQDGEVVTVDAEENAVYQGRVTELLRYQLMRSSSYEDAAEYRLLRRMLKKIAPLNLTDPQSPSFSSANCTTYHDIIRFAHEKAVERLTAGYLGRLSRRSRFVRRLELDIPLDLILIDLGGGLDAGGESRRVEMENVTSTPLRALVEGLTTPGVWADGPADMDLDGFMSSATRLVPLTSPLRGTPEQNLAIVSGTYLNLSLRLGYHFNIVDCYLTETRNENMIYFRFVGGVTELARRSRRAMVLKKILEKHDFVVEGKGDLVIGRIKKISCDEMADRLKMIGRLIGFTRQLDIFLRDDSLVDRCVKNFNEGEFRLFSQ